MSGRSPARWLSPPTGAATTAPQHAIEFAGLRLRHRAGRPDRTRAGATAESLYLARTSYPLRADGSGIAAATEEPPRLIQANAADFVEAELARPQADGTTRVLMHSIVWQYVPADQQARITAAMEAAGARATAERPLAWIALEANRTVHHHELVVRYWPGGAEPVKLAHAHAHGAWVEWLG